MRPIFLLIVFASCQQQTKQPVIISHETIKDLIVDYIHSYNDEQVYFCSAIFKPEKRDDDSTSLIEKEARKQISECDENRESCKYIIPQNLAKNTFAIIDTIWVYNVHGNLIGQANYLGHKFYEETISSEFVSEHKIIFNKKYKGLLNVPHYYSNQKSEIPRKVKWVENSILKSEISNQLIENEYNSRSEKTDLKLFQFKYENEEYAFYSNGNINVFLQKKDTSRAVYFLENAMLFDVNTTHFIKNGKPVFLLNCGQPESDYFFNLTLYWNGDKYEEK